MVEAAKSFVRLRNPPETREAGECLLKTQVAGRLVIVQTKSKCRDLWLGGITTGTWSSGKTTFQPVTYLKGGFIDMEKVVIAVVRAKIAPCLGV